MKHLLSLEKMARADMEAVFASVPAFKVHRPDHAKPLAGKSWAMIFAKSSTRTRVSFEVGIHELGGRPLFLNAGDIQLGRGEPVKDTARVLGRMVHGIVIRTYAQKEVEELAELACIPVVNALTDEEHPCQVLTDLYTIQEKLGSYAGKIITFVGDGACNVPISWVWAAAKLGFELRIAAPKNYQPAPELLQRAGGKVIVTDDLQAAASGADVLYTDVWVSMGKEAESAKRITELSGYQVNAALVKRAKPGALVMHCLPAYRGKEIDDATFEAHAATIFDQAENRLHVQKAILNWLVR
ncbi:MAG: Ornithine carbamoyltransferase [Verrucomicrobiota bacterium]|jgi:ornithine carbamoyltransferase